MNSDCQGKIFGVKIVRPEFKMALCPSDGEDGRGPSCFRHPFSSLLSPEVLAAVFAVPTWRSRWLSLCQVPWRFSGHLLTLVIAVHFMPPWRKRPVPVLSGRTQWAPQIQHMQMILVLWPPIACVRRSRVSTVERLRRSQACW